MKIVQIEDVVDEIQRAIQNYREKLLLSLTSMVPGEMLPKKNAYMYACRTVFLYEFACEIVNAAFASSEETLYGKVFEGLVHAILSVILPDSASKASAEGLDGDIVRNDTRYLLSVKSGRNWGNSSQVKQQEASFKKAKRRIMQDDKEHKLVTVMVVCYGSAKKLDISYADMKVEGQAAWCFLTGNPNFYTDMVRVMNTGAREFSGQVRLAKEEAVTRMLLELQKFQDPITGHIDFCRILGKFHSDKGSMEDQDFKKATAGFDKPETLENSALTEGD